MIFILISHAGLNPPVCPLHTHTHTHTHTVVSHGRAPSHQELSAQIYSVNASRGIFLIQISARTMESDKQRHNEQHQRSRAAPPTPVRPWLETFVSGIMDNSPSLSAIHSEVKHTGNSGTNFSVFVWVQNSRFSWVNVQMRTQTYKTCMWLLKGEI